MIHSLVGSDGAKRVLTARCGRTWDRKPSEPFPAELTAWAGLVTCPECKPSPDRPTARP